MGLCVPGDLSGGGGAGIRKRCESAATAPLRGACTIQLRDSVSQETCQEGAEPEPGRAVKAPPLHRCTGRAQFSYGILCPRRPVRRGWSRNQEAQ
ncbi:hypothetical protein NDU88_006131 [Pleurodeles waltl]|uniref:Uncharacterized protein n=1 Tax=Pleurodeles waltl TaxID=8319 RepID=A0AAV7VPN0_PLEWA|nr:hypothetical protein NDU88_006131 [Pleurodeles waltl]